MLRDDLLRQRADEHWEKGSFRAAFRIFLRLAKRGRLDGQLCVGYFYDDGLGVKPNPLKALHWYRLAYRKGSETAANNIGVIFKQQGKRRAALAWFKRAVELGFADAGLEAAKICLDQNRDVPQAIAFLERAISAKPENITEGSREEAQHLLSKVQNAVRDKRSEHSGS